MRTALRTPAAAWCLLLVATGTAGAQARTAPAFVGRPWLATDAAAAPGTIRIFLADGTLLMDSCGETYRLVRWRRLGPGRIAWTEDGARIEARVDQPRPTELRLVLQLRGDTREERYRVATVPFVCPETRPAPAPPGR